jgi:sulfopyruvate decarboxylase TPP-binding subunit
MTTKPANPLAILAGPPPSGPSMIQALKDAKIGIVLSVPDIVTSEGLLFPIARDESFRLIRVCKEDEAIGISAGLSYSAKRAVLLIQYTGLLDSINAVRAVAVGYKMPIVFMVGLLEKEPGVPPRQSALYGIRIVEPILEAMGIEHQLIETQADVARIRPAIESAYSSSRPTALLIGQRPLAS